MTYWIRVKNNENRNEYTTAVVRDDETILDKPATNRFGDPLPAKPHVVIHRKSSPTKGDQANQADKTEANKEAN